MFEESLATRIGGEENRSGREMETEHLTALDATFLELEEADQSAHMHIGAVMVFEPPSEGEPPSLRELRSFLGARLDRLPRFRQRLSAPRTGGLHWPAWIEDERFDLAHHVRAAALPDPAGEEELREWASAFFSERLDRARPLWAIVLLELADGRWALASKTHHCMVDGVGSVDIGYTILDTEPRREPASGERPEPVASPAPSAAEPQDGISLGRWIMDPPGAAGAAGARLVRRGVEAAQAAAGAASAAASAGAGVVVHPDRARGAAERARALIKVLVKDELVGAPRTSLNDPIGAARRLTVIEVPLDQLKEIKRTLGGTVNDVVLAATATGLRRLLVERNEELPQAGIRAMVPVNLRAAAERLELGNKITSLFVHLIVDEDDPLERYRRQLEEAEGLKASDQGIGSRQIIDLAAHAPPVIHTFLARALFATRLFNVTVTNVPGPPEPLYAFGSTLTAIWPLVPLAADHALGLAVISYAGRVFFCLNIARDSVPDVDVVAAGIADSIDELTALASSGANARERASA